MVTVKKQAVIADRGCYSVKYLDPYDDDWQFSMDYDWRANDDPARRNQWTCAESPTGTLHWAPVRVIPHHAFRALLKHFGLEESDVDMRHILTMSPADLVRLRRMKERREGLLHKVVMNMRMGCQESELADTFEAQP